MSEIRTRIRALKVTVINLFRDHFSHVKCFFVSSSRSSEYICRSWRCCYFAVRCIFHWILLLYQLEHEWKLSIHFWAGEGWQRDASKCPEIRCPAGLLPEDQSADRRGCTHLLLWQRSNQFKCFTWISEEWVSSPGHSHFWLRLWKYHMIKFPSFTSFREPSTCRRHNRASLFSQFIYRTWPL